MYKRSLLIFLIILLASFSVSFPVSAAKKRIKSSTSKTTSGGGLSFSKVSFFPNRLGMNMNFFNLGQVSKVSYVLSYTGSGKAQGVVGSFSPVGTTDARQLLFGTCSSGACVYHTNVTNAKLSLTFTLKNGKSIVKRYILKV